MDYLSCSNLINSIGLLFDIAGAVLLVKYGLPADVSKDGLVGMAFQQTNEQEKRKWKIYNRRSKIGLAFILVGFALQFLSDFIPK